MPQRFTCPQGHQWDLAAVPSPRSGPARPRCPVCGSAAAPEGAADAETLAPDVVVPEVVGETALSVVVLPEAAGETVAAPEVPAGESRPGPREVPGYEILGELGRGGMGVVYRARQLSLNRIVALKMILAGSHAGAQDLARFRAEAEAVARLQHPNIVQIFEVGEHEGLSFFTLEFVDGGSLADQLDGTPLPLRRAAQLVRTLATAVSAAHEQGVVHRDLKPANVLLTQDGRPKITDFGLAKRLDTAGQTQTGAVMGTPGYMAPEQAGGRSKNIGPLADVYALGAILYELLTGRPPFKAETPLDTMLQMLGEEPVPPSRLNRKIPPDLETICLKCLAKDPRRRYPSARVLANDLKHFLDGKPITARPAGKWERLRKWTKRRPAAAALVGVSVVAALGLLLGGAYFAHQLNEERNTAVAERDRAERQQQAARANLERARRLLLTNQLLRVAPLWEHSPAQALELLEDNELCPPELRDFTWRIYHRLCQRHSRTLAKTLNPFNRLAFSADGRLLATTGMGSRPEEIILWEVATGRERSRLRGHSGRVTCLAFSADGRTLATGGEDRTVKRWDVATGRRLSSVKGKVGTVRFLGLAADGKTVALAGQRTFPDRFGPAGWTLAVMDADTGREVSFGRLSPPFVYSLALSADGKTLAASVAVPEVMNRSVPALKVWDLATKGERALLKGLNANAAFLAFAPDGRTLASAMNGQILYLWDVPAGRFRAAWRGAFGPLGFTADGRTLLTRGPAGAKLWDVAAGRERFVFPGAFGKVAISPDGRTLASDGGGALKLWDVPRHRQAVAVLAGHTGKVNAVALTRDGKLLASAGNDTTARLWDVATGKTRTVLPHSQPVRAVAFSPDGQTLATGSSELVGGKPAGIICLWETATGRKRATLRGHIDPVTCLAFSPDGKTLAAAGEGLLKPGPKGGAPIVKKGRVRLWDVATRRERTSITQNLGGITCLAFSPDGKRLAVGFGIPAQQAFGGDVLVADLTAPDGEPVFLSRVPVKQDTKPRDMTPVTCLAFSPRGRILARGSGGRDPIQQPLADKVTLWHSASWQPYAALAGHTGLITALSFSADGRTLATASRDRTVRLWDLETRQEILSLKGHRGEVTSVAFSADGKTLVSGGAAGEVIIWERPRP
jgi:WD40 repeat protein